MNYKYSIPILCLLLLIFSCTGNRKNSHYLDRAETLMQEHPDSALMALDSIAFLEELDEEQFHRFQLLQAQAKRKAYRNIASDTLIFLTKDYYVD